MGWCYGPRREIIEDALEFVQHWTEFDEKLEPEPELEHDGVLSLQIYDQDRFLRGGIRFTGNHEADYSIVNRLKTLESGEFCTKSISQILNAIKTMNSALSKF